MIIIPWRLVIKRLALSFALIPIVLVFSGCTTLNKMKEQQGPSFSKYAYQILSLPPEEQTHKNALGIAIQAGFPAPYEAAEAVMKYVDAERNRLKEITVAPYQTATVNVSGNWSGLWKSGIGIGGSNLSMNLIQKGSYLNGTILIEGSSCFSAGNIYGTVSGNNIACTIFSGDLRIDFNGTLVENNMNGSYVVINGGVCTGDSGSWKVSR